MFIEAQHIIIKVVILNFIYRWCVQEITWTKCLSQLTSDRQRHISRHRCSRRCPPGPNTIRMALHKPKVWTIDPVSAFDSVTLEHGNQTGQVVLLRQRREPFSPFIYDSCCSTARMKTGKFNSSICFTITF